jgi:hypothetical protein
MRGSVLVGLVDGSDQIRASSLMRDPLSPFGRGPPAEAVGAAKNRLSVHSDQGGRFSCRQQRFATRLGG